MHQVLLLNARLSIHRKLIILSTVNSEDRVEHVRKQKELTENENDRLRRQLEGGRPREAITIEQATRASEKVIDQESFDSIHIVNVLRVQLLGSTPEASIIVCHDELLAIVSCVCHFH